MPETHNSAFAHPTQRTSRSKRARFEIFERDGFTCQYCGAMPPDVTLQLDHIHPISKGGADTEDNLTTACRDCNAGKSNRILGAVIPRPDADAEYMRTQQEIAEARMYLEAQTTARFDLHGNRRRCARGLARSYSSLFQRALNGNAGRLDQ
jgi:hypothetical protein